jgi:tetratricopeptide (TPR) repeat protein
MNRAASPPMAACAPGPAGGWQVLAVAGILILATLGAYWNSFNVPFLLDDHLAIADNPSLRHLGRLGDVLSPPAGTIAGRPLLNFTFALNFAGGGTSVRGYHAVNLLIHVCAGLALLGIVRRTLLLPRVRHRFGEAALPLAAFAALLWTLHPLQTESVTYISQRAESLMGLFYLLTLYGFIRSVTAESRNCWLILSVAACFCGMATKQVMVTAPVLVLLYDRAFVSGSFRSALAKRHWYYASLAAIWFWLGVLMHQSSLAAISVGFQTGVSWPTYGLTELRVVTGYLKLALWPHPLVFDYGSEILATDPLAVAPYALIIAALLAGVMIVWRRSPKAGFLGCWFFLILAPTSTVVPIAGQPMAESRMYLPLAGVVVLMTLLSYAFGQRRVFIVLGIVAVGLGALTIQRNRDYRSELSIWEDTVARHPRTARGHSNLGVVLAEMPGRLPEAIAHYEEALRLKPDFAEAHNDLANALAQLPNRLPEAIAHYEEALRLKSDFPEAHYDLALAFKKMPGRAADVITHYEATLRLKPDFAEAHYNLANSLAQMPGRWAEVIAHYNEALRLKPDFAEAHYNLANALAQRPGRLAEAIAQYEEALCLNPDYAEAHNNFALALEKIPARRADVIAHYEEALRLNPDFAEAHYDFALALEKMPGRLAEAVAHYETAVRLKPDFAEAHFTLAYDLAQMPGRMADAIAHFETVVRLQPDFVDARNDLAVYYAQTGRWEAAIDQLEIAARLDPASTAIRDNLGKLKARKKP